MGTSRQSRQPAHRLAALGSAPDGYTVMFVAASHVMNPAIVKKLPYDTVKDFTTLGLIADNRRLNHCRSREGGTP